YWVQISEIIWINILLSGDNAVVIALACRALPPQQRMWGMTIGASVAIVMRIACAAFVTTLMTFPYIKLIGGCALLYIAVTLLGPPTEDKDRHEQAIKSNDSFLTAVKTIAVADVIMSLDNMIAVAAAAGGDYILLSFGLAMSIPLIVAGATV